MPFGDWRSAECIIGWASFAESGIPNHVASVASIGLTAIGPRLDAELNCLNKKHLQALLEQNGVVVVPGFIGNNEQNQTCLLGRGGSDLTALFIAARLSARCRLVKDVDGLYEFDPKRAGPARPRRFSHVTFDEALKLDESIIQHKAIRFAEQSQLPFEVTTWNSENPTVVGASERRSLGRIAESPRPIKVALLGVGTVGGGVYQRLTQQYCRDFEVVAVACRDRRKALAAGVRERLLVGDGFTAVDTDCDVVVELVGGVELPNVWIRRALEQGRHVVTANKSLLAYERVALQELANDNQVSLSFSAAVGGCMPALELIQSVVDAGGQVISFDAVLNGSCNFILGEIGRGQTLAEAVSKAGELGLTEANPHRDLAGIDAAEKLALLASACGYPIELSEIPRQSLTEETIAKFNLCADTALRQVASYRASENGVSARSK